MASPSEFLTFYRRAVTSTPRMLRSAQRPATRGFAISAIRRKDGVDADQKAKKDKHHDTEHAVDKAHSATSETYDIQSSNAKHGMDSANKSGRGGVATERKDTTGSQAKAKKEFPEAPDTVGMQDERGGRGA